MVRLPGDAASGRALVLTTDVIAPLVDDAESFGAIAATNAVSDVYAMGGRPLYALNLAFFPDQSLPLEVLRAILRGGARACERMGVAIVGGHTVRDSALKYGLAVTGEVDSERAWRHEGGRAGQELVLTKALGTGVLGTAIKRGEASAADSAAAIASMSTANRAAAEIGQRFAVSACTDVTGFGLLGHLRNIVRASAVDAELELDALPLLPGALEHARAGRVPGGSKANLAFLAPMLAGADEVDPALLALAADAQTSGGLLLCVAPEHSAAMLEALRASGLPAARVGRLQPQSDPQQARIALR